MIELLRIRNLALIEDMELEFSPGYNVLTGETGAGKSFILKAIGFLTGEKMPGEYVRPGAEKAVRNFSSAASLSPRPAAAACTSTATWPLARRFWNCAPGLSAWPANRRN